MHALFVSPDAAMQRLAQEARDALAKEGHAVELLPFPRFDELYGVGVPAPSDNELPKEVEDVGAPALIIHSSGTLYK